MEHHWVHHSSHSIIPAYAVVGGHDVDGTQIYVGRAFHEGENLPAKVIPSKNVAYVCWQGEEFTKNHYEILVGQRYGWVPCYKGRIPPNAVRSGVTVSGESLYIGRGHFEGSLTVGKIHPSHECLYIPFGGKEHRLDACEALVYEQQAFAPYPINSHRENYKWIPSNPSTGIPPNALLGGHDSDGSVIYVGRAYHNGDMLTTKIIPSKHSAYVSWSGQEIPKDQYEILCGSNLVWRSCYDHIIPPNAILAGRTALGQPVYIGRGHWEGSLTVGKVSSVHRALFIPYAGIERRLETYEILVEDNLDPGWALNHPQPAPVIAICPPAPYPTAPPVNITWIPSGPNNYIPPNAVHVGHDIDMSPIYVGRAFHDGNLLPAKAIPSRNCAYISNSGYEIQKFQYQMLIIGDGYHWENARDGYIPPNAIEGGHTVNGETLFIGRAHYNSSLVLGKIQKSHNCIYFPYGGLERSSQIYEVLVSGPVASLYPNPSIVKLSYS